MLLHPPYLIMGAEIQGRGQQGRYDQAELGRWGLPPCGNLLKSIINSGFILYNKSGNCLSLILWDSGAI